MRISGRPLSESGAAVAARSDNLTSEVVVNRPGANAEVEKDDLLCLVPLEASMWLLLLRELGLGKDSLQAPFLETIPAELTNLPYLEEDALQWLEGTTLTVLGQLGRQEEEGVRLLTPQHWRGAPEARMHFDQTLLPFLELHGHWWQDRSFESFQRALGAVLSRGFFCNGRGPFMVPFADAFNHATPGTNHCHLEGCAEDGLAFVMRGVKGAASGQEVFNTYGPLSSGRLFASFGFVGAENPHDYNVIKLAELLLHQPQSFGDRQQRLAKDARAARVLLASVRRGRAARAGVRQNVRRRAGVRVCDDDDDEIRRKGFSLGVPPGMRRPAARGEALGKEGVARTFKYRFKLSSAEEVSSCLAATASTELFQDASEGRDGSSGDGARAKAKAKVEAPPPVMGSADAEDEVVVPGKETTTPKSRASPKRAGRSPKRQADKGHAEGGKDLTDKLGDFGDSFGTQFCWAGMHGGMNGTGLRPRWKDNPRLPQLVGKPATDDLHTPCFVRHAYRHGTVTVGPPYRVTEDASIEKADWVRPLGKVATYSKILKERDPKLGPDVNIRVASRTGGPPLAETLPLNRLAQRPPKPKAEEAMGYTDDKKKKKEKKKKDKKKGKGTSARRKKEEGQKEEGELVEPGVEEDVPEEASEVGGEPPFELLPSVGTWLAPLFLESQALADDILAAAFGGLGIPLEVAEQAPFGSGYLCWDAVIQVPVPKDESATGEAIVHAIQHAAEREALPAA
ncbi:N-lysine methyltransferase SETD6 [Symbiodinium microadriaticum]|uniref:N-lysine methyltransferase SETD6 n=1 Tax=Symbiodinium microadriaticum TaxID=2951 RepID=A0A1Q9DUV0_SYMMI|nr:N-lysine methyltransferase SETD6 [Symbiodinium microadriaticum]